MTKEKIPFEDFLNDIPTEHIEFVEDLNKFLLENNCNCDIKEAKSGYVVSYIYKPAKKTIANYVFRKKGPMLRLYADNVAQNDQLINELPDDMKAIIAKSPVCKRLLNPDDCNSRCQKGYEFVLDGKIEQKCRFNCFFFLLSEQNNPYLKKLIETEIAYRQA